MVRVCFVYCNRNLALATLGYKVKIWVRESSTDVTRHGLMGWSLPNVKGPNDIEVPQNSLKPIALAGLPNRELSHRL